MISNDQHEVREIEGNNVSDIPSKWGDEKGVAHGEEDKEGMIDVVDQQGEPKNDINLMDLAPMRGYDSKTVP